MPHNSHSSHTRHDASSGDDLGSTDEVKIFKDEGDREDEKISSENLLVEEKSSLIDLTESEEKSAKILSRQDHSPVFSKLESHAASFNMGYLVSPYPYSNGSAAGLPVTMANKIGLPGFFCSNGDPLTTPPPAHCGIPPYQLDPKSIGLARPALYPFSSSQYPYPMLSPDMSQVASWHTPSVYSAASSFRSPYPTPLPINTTLSSEFPFRFSPSLLPSVHTSPHHVLNSHPAIITSANTKQDCSGQEPANHRYARSMESKMSPSSQGNDCKDITNDKKKPHIKKPLNAFMLYMKEMRAKVVAECTLKESAAINQILGRRWHELTREEQSKYYEKARQERQLHMELYPGWSARDNYGYVSKKKKRKKDRSPADSGGNNMKKCRARFGLDQQNQWCKPCRRKKKCIRYMEATGNYNPKDEHQTEFDDLDDNISEEDNDVDNYGSCGSADDSKTADDTDSLHQSLSSPTCMTTLTSLQSPSTSLPSPLSLLTSPATPTATPTLINVDPLKHHKQQQQQHQHLHPHQQYLTNQSPSSTHPTSLLPTSLVSTSSSSSGSSNSGSNSTSTSSTSSPASLSDRMMRSLLTTSPAVMLGNRFSHLAMGITNGSGPEQSVHIAPIAAASSKTGNFAANILSSTAPDNLVLSSSSSQNINSCLPLTLLRENKLLVASPLPRTSPPLPSATSSPVASDFLFEKSAPQRNPIGANPRDINNPLSINQLTKRSVNTQESSSSEINPLYINQHVTSQTESHSTAPPAPTSFRSTFSQNMQPLKSHDAIPDKHTQLPRSITTATVTHNVLSLERNEALINAVSATDLAAGLPVISGLAVDNPPTNGESGAISVT